MIKENMHKAYSIANELLRDKLKEEAPDILADLDDINESDVIVTVGQHDRIESVFSKVNTPHNLIHPEQLRGLRLDPDQIVFVNCPGQFDDRGLRRLNQFVEEGGFLFTTDWALKHVLEQAFPGYVRYNNQSTADEVVRVEVLSGDDPFLNSILGPDDDPQWWLEGSAFNSPSLTLKASCSLVRSSTRHQDVRCMWAIQFRISRWREPAVPVPP